MKKLALVIVLISSFFGVNGFSADSDSGVVWIDVRSLAEHMVDHIEGDPRIPHTDIVEEVTVLFPDRDTEIRLYCRSGGRAEKAKLALEGAGYTHVVNVGGIDDAREIRGESP